MDKILISEKNSSYSLDLGSFEVIINGLENQNLNFDILSFRETNLKIDLSQDNNLKNINNKDQNVQLIKNLNFNLYKNSILDLNININFNNLILNININLIQENSRALINIFNKSGDNSNTEIYTFQNHLFSKSYSNLIVKRIINNFSDSKFQGKILIEQDAFDSEASLKDSALVLADNIKNISVPILEIKNKNVKCKHAFYVYNIDLSQKNYLKSRSLNDAQIDSLIYQAFINS